MRFFTLLFLCFGLGLSAQSTAEQANLLGRWSNDQLVGSSQYANVYNEVWGMAYEGREYAIIGSTAGTHFIDVTDPSTPTEVAFVEGASVGTHIIHRDYHNMGCHLYAVCDEGVSSLQIMDISGLPESVEVVYDTNETLQKAHNIFIDTTLAKLYCFAAFGGPQAGSALRIYDISSPAEPEFIAEYNQFADVSAGHVHDGYVDNGLAYLNCGYDGFAMVDFSDPLNPVTLGTMTQYPFAGYNHSGWPSADGQYYYLGDENHGYPVKVLDVSDADDIHSIGTLETTAPDINNTIPHNQLVACNYLYISYYYDGLHVYDISDPANPVLAKYYDTSNWAFDNNYRGAWGVYPFLPSGNLLISDMQEGLFVVEGMGDACHLATDSEVSCGIVNNQKEVQLIDEVMELFPNPAKDFVNINISADYVGQSVHLQISDVHGRIIVSNKDYLLSDTQIDFDLSDLQTGLYFIQINNDEWMETEKLMIAR